ncbi:BgTH12-04976 [Blumeria graminis f. sp. triticale]|uniref:BgTH12-04976 n=1 Tax=Blumeria graminis f. sp. triticale TaxID=1689686 RepID=A0A9W4D1F2_BLUGR|nr:BgTH12-04976 [Blumeria graminis f. sp. triticale]
MDIIAVRTMSQQEDQEEHEDEEAAEPPDTINQALNGLKRLLSFKDYLPDSDSVELMTLLRIKRSLQHQAELNRGQGALDN